MSPARWDDAENEMLCLLYEQKRSVSDIAAQLYKAFEVERSERSIIQHIHRLRSKGKEIGWRKKNWHKWTPEESKYLQSLYQSGVNNAEIARRMRNKFGGNFSNTTVAAYIYDCKIRGSLKSTGKKRILTSNLWTQEEDDLLCKLYEGNMPVPQISSNLKERFGKARSGYAIISRLYILGKKRNATIRRPGSKEWSERERELLRELDALEEKRESILDELRKCRSASAISLMKRQMKKEMKR